MPTARFRRTVRLHSSKFEHTHWIDMSQLLTKFALYALTAVAIFDIARYRHHRRSAGTAKKALMTWEGEGGSHP